MIPHFQTTKSIFLQLGNESFNFQVFYPEKKSKSCRHQFRSCLQYNPINHPACPQEHLALKIPVLGKVMVIIKSGSLLHITNKYLILSNVRISFPLFSQAQVGPVPLSPSPFWSLIWPQWGLFLCRARVTSENQYPMERDLFRRPRCPIVLRERVLD